MVRSKVWDWSIGSLEVFSYAGVHPVWPLKAGGSLQSLAFNLSAASILRRNYSVASKNKEGKRADICQQDICRQDICQRTHYLIVIIKSPLDREEGPVGP